MIENARISIIRGGYNRCTPDWNRNRETWAFEKVFAYFLPVRGEATMEMEQGGAFHLRPGSLYFISTHQLLRQTCAREMCVYWVTFVSESYYLHHRLLGIRNGYYELPLKILQGIKSIFMRFPEAFMAEPVRETLGPHPEDSLMRSDASAELAIQIEAAVMLLNGKLLELTHGEFGWTNRAELERLRPAIDFMDEQYLHVPSLDEVAKCVNMSPLHFHRIFKDQTGMTPFKYMENRRLDLASKLLSDVRLNITEIASKVGYENPHYFSRAFRKRFGRPPTEMRSAAKLDSEAKEKPVRRKIC